MKRGMFTCVSCKVLEHIVFCSIMDHVDLHNILVQSPHGFRNKHSCETQLVNTFEDLARWLYDREQLDLPVLDFSKAFHTVAHQRLLGKFRYYGIRDSTLNWIRHWLTGRSQRVAVEGDCSSEVAVKSGIPQRTVLGPLMFILYINAISNNTSSNIKLFADDCLIYRRIKDHHEGIYHWPPVWPWPTLPVGMSLANELQPR